MLKTKMLAMLSGVAVLASALVPGIASAHERDGWQRDGWQRGDFVVQTRARADLARELRFEHARLHAQNPYLTRRQHAWMHRMLERRYAQRERQQWRAERERWRSDRW